MRNPTRARVLALAATAAATASLGSFATSAAPRTKPSPMAGVRPTSTAGPRLPFPEDLPRTYGMFSRAGDLAIRGVLDQAAHRLKRGVAREWVLSQVRTGWVEVAVKHREAYDTAVAQAAADALDPFLAAAGYQRVQSLDEIRP